MTLAETRQVMLRYLDSNHTDVSMMADDVVFMDMTTGDEIRGPEAVLQILDNLYRIAFKARFEVIHTLFTENRAVLEGYFCGVHSGEFAGFPATGRKVRVPMCCIYDLQEGRILRARIYFELPVLMAQLSTPFVKY